MSLFLQAADGSVSQITTREHRNQRLHKRVRSTDNVSKSTFYGQERPIFLNGKIVLSTAVSLPRMSSSYVLNKNEKPIRSRSGQSFDESQDDPLLHVYNFIDGKTTHK